MSQPATAPPAPDDDVARHVARGPAAPRISPAAAHQAIGDLIHLLGHAVDQGRVRPDAAVAELRRADPTLTEHGARMQLQCWATAPARYAPPPAAPGNPTRVARPRDWRHEPIHFHRATA